jgi:hypothetical protein
MIKSGESPIHFRVARTIPGGSQPCRSSPPFTNSATPTPATPLFRRCGGKSVRCPVPGARVTTWGTGARTTTGQDGHAPGATVADAPFRTSPPPAWPRVSGPWATGCFPPASWACRVRRGALPGRWGSLAAPVSVGGGGDGRLPWPMQWSVHEQGLSRRLSSTPPRASRAKPSGGGRRRWGTGRGGAASSASRAAAIRTQSGQP